MAQAAALATAAGLGNTDTYHLSPLLSWIRSISVHLGGFLNGVDPEGSRPLATVFFEAMSATLSTVHSLSKLSKEPLRDTLVNHLGT